MGEEFNHSGSLIYISLGLQILLIVVSFEHRDLL